jgi:hypothetical protein
MSDGQVENFPADRPATRPPHVSSETKSYGRGHVLARAPLQIALVLVVLYAVGLALSNVATLIDLQSSRFNGTAEQGEFEDYVAFYVAGEFVLEGNGSSIYDAEVIAEREHEIVGREIGGTGSLAFFNPPFVALMFAPLALLPLATAGLVLLLGNLILVIAAGAVLQRQLGITSWKASAALWLGVLSFEPALYVIGQGQLSMFLVWGFLGFFIFQRKDKPALSGLALALLLVKPQSAILAVLLLAWKRQWRALASFSGVAGALVIASVAVSGPAVLWQYPEFLIESSGWEDGYGVFTQHMYGWNGFLSTLLAQNSLPYVLTTILLTVASVGSVFFAFRGPWRASSPAFPFAVGALAVATLLINPHAYLHDVALIGLALGFALLGCRDSRKASSRFFYLGLVALGWVLLSQTLWLQYGSNLNLVTPVLGALLIFLVRDSRRSASTATQQLPNSPLYAFPEDYRRQSRIAG